MKDREETLRQCNYTSVTPEQFLKECDAYGGIIECMNSGLRSTNLDNSNPQFKKIIRDIEDIYFEFDLEVASLYSQALELTSNESD